MKILIQNKGAGALFMTINGKGNKRTGVAQQIMFEGDNSVTEISEEIYEEKMKNNRFWLDKIEKGVIVVLNNSGVRPEQAAAEAVTSRELNYSRYKILMSDIEASGGINSPDIAQHLDPQGMPKLQMVRANMGSVDPQKISEYRARYIAEKAAGLGGLKLPSGKMKPLTSHNVEEKIEKIKEDKPLVNKSETEDIVDDINGTDESIKYSAEELGDLDREVLFDIAKDNGVEPSRNIRTKKLIEVILEKQEEN